MNLGKMNAKRKYNTSFYDDYLIDEIVRNGPRHKVVTNKPPMMTSNPKFLQSLNDPIHYRPFPPGSYRVPENYMQHCPVVAKGVEQETWFKGVFDKINSIRSFNEIDALVYNPILAAAANSYILYVDGKMDKANRENLTALHTGYINNTAGAGSSETELSLTRTTLADNTGGVTTYDRIKKIDDQIESVQSLNESIYTETPFWFQGTHDKPVTPEDFLNEVYENWPDLYSYWVRSEDINSIGFASHKHNSGDIDTEYLFNVVTYGVDFSQEFVEPEVYTLCYDGYRDWYKYLEPGNFNRQWAVKCPSVVTVDSTQADFSVFLNYVNEIRRRNRIPELQYDPVSVDVCNEYIRLYRLFGDRVDLIANKYFLNSANKDQINLSFPNPDPKLDPTYDGDVISERKITLMKGAKEDTSKVKYIAYGEVYTNQKLFEIPTPLQFINFLREILTEEYTQFAQVLFENKAYTHIGFGWDLVDTLDKRIGVLNCFLRRETNPDHVVSFQGRCVGTRYPVFSGVFPKRCPTNINLAINKADFDSAFRLINRTRFERGISLLTWDDRLVEPMHQTMKIIEKNYLYRPAGPNLLSFVPGSENRSPDFPEGVDRIGYQLKSLERMVLGNALPIGDGVTAENQFEIIVSYPVQGNVLKSPIDFVSDLLTELNIRDNSQSYLAALLTHSALASWAVEDKVSNPHQWYQLFGISTIIDQGTLDPLPISRECLNYPSRRLVELDPYARVWPPICGDYSPTSYSDIEGDYEYALNKINEERVYYGLDPVVVNNQNMVLCNEYNWLYEKLEESSAYDFYFDDLFITEFNPTGFVNEIDNITGGLLPRYSSFAPKITIENVKSVLNIVDSNGIYIAFAVKGDVGLSNPNDAIEWLFGNMENNDMMHRITEADVNSIGFGWKYIETPETRYMVYNVYASLVESGVEWVDPVNEELAAVCVNNSPRLLYDPVKNYQFPLVCPDLRDYDNLFLTFSTTLDIINRYRSELGYDPVVWSERLAYLADRTNMYAKANELYNDVGALPRLQDYRTNGAQRSSNRINYTGPIAWTNFTDAETCLGRIDDIGFIDNGLIINAERECPVIYISPSQGTNPHDYIFDVLLETITNSNLACLDANATHVGLNYLIEYTATEDFTYFNLVVGGGSDPEWITPTDFESPCFDPNGFAPPQDIDPAYANPLTKPCPTWPNVPEWPIVCPTPYTYEAMAAIAAPIISEMNGYRVYRGMQPMVWNKNLTWAAQVVATYNHYHPGAGHITPLSPHGAGLGERVAASNFIGAVGGQSEGLANIAGSGGAGPNPLSVWCMFKNEYVGEGQNNAHFNPFSIPEPAAEARVRAYNSVGIGWTRKLDDPFPGWVNVGVYFVYGNSLQDNQANAPPLEDPLILCTEEMPDIGDIKSSLLTINHNGWYNLNGQQIDENTKPFAAQNASTIFGGTFLPDLSDAVLSQQTLKTISGTNDVNVLIDNLPNLSLSGATSPFSDVLNTDLNGSGLQPLIDGTTVGSTLPVTTGFGGGLITTLNGSTAAYSTVVDTNVAGDFTGTLSGSTAPFSGAFSSSDIGALTATGSTTSSGPHVHNFNVGQANDFNGPLNVVVSTDDAMTTGMGITQEDGNHGHSVSVSLPNHVHQTTVNIPSLAVTSSIGVTGHAHNSTINIPALGVTTPFNMSGHTHDLDVNIPSTSVTGNVNIPTHSHSMDLEIPSLAVTVPLNGLQQPLSVKGKRFGVNFFIYLGIG